MHPCARSDLILGTVLLGCSSRQGVCTYLGVQLRRCEGTMTVGTLSSWSLCRLMFFAAYRAVLKPPESFIVPRSWTIMHLYFHVSALACQHCDFLHN